MSNEGDQEAAGCTAPVQGSVLEQERGGPRTRAGVCVQYCRLSVRVRVAGTVMVRGEG